MIAAHIDDGDVVLMEPSTTPSSSRPATIVAAMVEGRAPRLKHFQPAKGAMVAPGSRQPRLCAAAESRPNRCQCKGKLVAVLAPRS